MVVDGMVSKSVKGDSESIVKSSIVLMNIEGCLSK
jgi:hypothetical protein